MQMRKLGKTGVEVAPLVLGGNVFGWTADRETSFAILDAFFEAGFNAIDTADVYFRYAPGNKGGESEMLIGEWMKERGNRDKVVIITKGGLEMGEGMAGLGRDYLPKACEASLQRLQTDYIDVYMSHMPDPATPIAETLEVYRSLIDAGKVRHAAASNYSAEQLQEAVDAAGTSGAAYAVLEPKYNLAERDLYEGDLEDVCLREGIGVIPYYGLAAGFLSGKYRSKDQLEGKARGGSVAHLLTPEGIALLDRIEAVATRHGSTSARVSLAWLLTRPSIAAPIVSATSLTQLADILKSVDLKLTKEDLAELEG